MVKGFKYYLKDDALIVEFKRPAKVLSSAPFNGGLRSARAIVNLRVSSNFNEPDPTAILSKTVNDLGLPKETVGMMTAANVHNFSAFKGFSKEFGVVVLVTAGLSHPAVAGDRVSAVYGTINIIVVIDGRLSDECLVNCVATITEAKAAVLNTLDVRSRYSNEVATGTVTDVVVVASTEKGKEFHYAGHATKLGSMIGRGVRKALEETIEKEEKIKRNRPIIQRLNERGLKLDFIVEAGLELIVSPANSELLAKLLKEELMKNLSDVNISSFILAALRLEEEGERGSIPGLGKDEFTKDPVKLLADESIGIAISNYIAGTKAIHNFFYIERKKPGILKKLGPFLDDAIGGLIAGSLTKLLGENQWGSLRA